MKLVSSQHHRRDGAAVSTRYYCTVISRWFGSAAIPYISVFQPFFVLFFFFFFFICIGMSAIIHTVMGGQHRWAPAFLAACHHIYFIIYYCIFLIWLIKLLFREEEPFAAMLVAHRTHVFFGGLLRPEGPK